MEELIEDLTFGNVTEVKVVLASIATALAAYQVFLMAVGWGKLKLPFLDPKPASFVHRSIGDSIVLITLLVAFMCIGYFEVSDGIEHAQAGEQDRATVHVVGAFALLGMLGLKIAIVRWWHGLSRFLPLLGIGVFTLFLVTWISSAGDYLWGS